MQHSIADMPLEQQIGQLLIAGFRGTNPTPEIIDLIRRCHLGSVILFSRNIRDNQQVLELTHSLQMIAKEAGQPYPLLIMADQENGLVNRLGPGTTTFPGNMALGAIGSEQIAFDIALATGREMKALGVNMNLAPVLDVNNNPDNPVIGVRSFGEDPQLVARLAAAMVRGYRAAGVIADIKHFPGHGDTAVDTHLALPTIPYGLERLEAVELVPFRSSIAAGAETAMVGHVYFPQIMADQKLPATVSPAIIQGLLRKDLGFEGVIVSDCLEMGAITDTVGTERGAVMALQAGTDLILVCHTYSRQRGSYEAIQAALHSGEVSPEMIRQAAQRVLRLKARYLSWDDLPTPPVPEWVGGEEHRRLRDRVYALSTTLVRSDDALIPLHPRPEERILVISPPGDRLTMVEDRGYSAGFLVASIRQRHAQVDSLLISAQPGEEECEQVARSASAYDLVIMVTVNAHLNPAQARLMQRLARAGRPLIGIAARNPYDLLAFPQLRTYLVTYEYSEPALAAAVRVLFGEIQPQGRLPVSLPGLYPRGHRAPVGPA